MANTEARDAAMRRLTRVNRWLIAGSVTLTGVFAEVAAHAFPGKTIAAPSAAKTTPGGQGKDPAGHSSGHSASGSGGLLRPPEAPPQSAPATSTSGEGATTQESPAGQESAPSADSQSAPSAGSESARSQQAAPAQEAPPSQQSTPSREGTSAQESARTQQSAPSQESSAPVVSGGS
jgi:hypothetical protein